MDDETEITRELTQAQEAFTAGTRALRLRRHQAVTRALDAGWSKYRIAATLGVKGATVNSIIGAARREAAKAEDTTS